jgi:hypothetical protein
MKYNMINIEMKYDNEYYSLSLPFKKLSEDVKFLFKNGSVNCGQMTKDGVGNYILV